MTSSTLSPSSGPINLPATHVAALAEPPPTFTPYDPPLSAGMAQVLRGERARLFRMLDVRDHRRLPKLAAVLEILEDLADQAPAVDDELARQQERRTAAAAARPRLAGVLSKRGDS